MLKNQTEWRKFNSIGLADFPLNLKQILKSVWTLRPHMTESLCFAPLLISLSHYPASLWALVLQHLASINMVKCWLEDIIIIIYFIYLHTKRWLLPSLPSQSSSPHPIPFASEKVIPPSSYPLTPPNPPTHTPEEAILLWMFSQVAPFPI